MNKLFFFLASTLMLLECAAEPNPVLELSDLSFRRDGIAWDASGNEIAPNVPLKLSGGWRIVAGSFVNHAPQKTNGIQTVEKSWESNIIHFPANRYPRKIGIAFDAKGNSPLQIEVLANGKEILKHYFSVTETFKRNKTPLIFLPKSTDSLKLQICFQTNEKADIQRLQVEETTNTIATPNCAEWVPAGAVRETEGFYFTEEQLQEIPFDNFTIRIKFSLNEIARMQTLFEQTLQGQWHPLLQFSAQNGKFILHSSHAGVRTTKTETKVVSGKIYEAFIVRSGSKANLYIDSIAVANLDSLPPDTPFQTTLGTGGLKCSMDGILYESQVWDRALSANEIHSLVTTKNFEKSKTLKVRVRSYIRHLARGHMVSEYAFTVENHSNKRIENGKLIWVVGTLSFEKTFGSLNSGESKNLTIRPTITLPPGKYTQTVSVESNGTTLFEKHFPLSVTPAPEKLNNLQIVTWYQSNSRENGFTSGASRLCAEAMENGMHWGPYQLRYIGTPRGNHPEDMTAAPDKRRVPDNFYSQYMKEKLQKDIAETTDRLAFYPALKAIDVNNEFPWYSHVNLCKQAVRDAREKFNIDLSPWLAGNGRNAILPAGRLAASYGRYPVPADRIIPANDPFYRWHVATKGHDGNMDIFTDRTIMEIIKKRHPRLKTVYAPVIRRIASPGYGAELDVAQNWNYDLCGFKIVFMQENIRAMIRHTPSTKMSSFPAFLVRPIGPYSSYPTPDMFRANVWASMMYPIESLVFFQANEMLNGKFSIPKTEIDKQLGSESPSEKDAAEKIRVQKLKIAGRPEGLPKAFRKFTTQELHSFKALFPKWEIQTRQAAIYISFANDLFSETRWPDPYKGLGEELTASGIPFDILYDDDFLRNPEVLNQYNVVCVPNLNYALKPAADALKSFAANPQKHLFLSDNSTFDIPHAIRISIGKQNSPEKDEILTALRKKYGEDSGNPQYVEAVNDRLAELASGTRQVLRPHLKKIDFDARSLTDNTFLNFLTLDSTPYLGIVNDKRTWGAEFGHFRKVPEKGVPQDCEIRFKSKFGKYAYNLISGKELKVISNGTFSEITVPLGGGDAAIIMLTKKPFVFECSINIERKNGTLRCIAETKSDISMPVYLRVEGADDLSASALFRNGKLVFEVPNDPAIKGFTIEESITGKKIERKIQP